MHILYDDGDDDDVCLHENGDLDLEKIAFEVRLMFFISDKRPTGM